MPRKKTENTHEKTETVKEKVIEKAYLIDRAVISRRATALNPEPHDVYAAAASLVQKEKLSYENANQGIKESLKRAYKNYLGIFDEPYDPYTGRKKIFSPLTHNIVDSVAKPVSVESSSIKILPMSEESRTKAKIINMVLPYFLQSMDFNSFMREFVHRTAWLGTQVAITDWVYEEIEVSTEKEADVMVKQLRGFAYKQKIGTKTRVVKQDHPRVRSINIMDIYAPATAESLKWCCKHASVIVRSQMTVSEVQSNPLYDDTIKATLSGRTWEGRDRYDSSSLNQYALAGYIGGETKVSSGMEFPRSENPMVSIFDRYGMIPKSWITGDYEKDALINVPGIVTTVSDSNGGDMRTLCVRISPFGESGPFEEERFNTIPNRWYGEGLAERLIPLQTWHNEVINNRRNNEILVQHRMFIYKKGTVDPRQFTARPGGGIAVDNMADVQALQMQDISQSSFAEDSSIESAAQRLAGAAQTPIQKKVTATEIQNIQANANITYNELRETTERFVERLILRHIIPLLQKYYSGKRTIPIKLPFSEATELDTYNGYAPFATDKFGLDRFIFLDDPSIFDGDFAVTVDIEGATITRQSQASALQNSILMASKLQQPDFNINFAFRKMNELMGLYDDRLFEKPQTPNMPSGVTGTNMAPPGGMTGGANPMQAMNTILAQQGMTG